MVSYDHENPMDQAYQLRQLMEGPRPASPVNQRAHIIAVASGKGGVGKTQVAVNLSIALAARNYRILLLDLDMGLANADLVLGLESTASWSDLFDGRRELDDNIISGPGGLDFVPGASGVARMAGLSEFERHQLLAAVRRLESRYDLIVLDCGAGISPNVLTFAAAADTILVVTTPEPTAITDAYAAIKAFVWEQNNRGGVGQAAGIGLIVNMAESRREGRETFERLAGVAARFLHLPVNDYGYILRDEHVPAAVRQRHPVILHYPRCSACTCLMATAARLARELGQSQEPESLFYRVMNMFL
ncbi:MAG: MinD/ParA family protein [Phycisphaerales bacterium]|nr:MinD/ParA family protein [Phycisphaerales bacterium]